MRYTQSMRVVCLGVLLVAIIGFFVSENAVAQSAEEKGWEIAKVADRQDHGFGDFTAAITMISRNRHGDENLREASVKVLEGYDEGDKYLIIFNRPQDVKGTGFLSHTRKLVPNEQWLYLPRVKRTKRIGSKKQSRSFMGSEFAYEDLASPEVEKYTYKYLREEAYDGQQTYVVERKPRHKYSRYERQVVWYDQEEYRILKIDFYDRKDALLKTLSYQEYNQYPGQYWQPNEMHMVNHQTGKSTILKWQNYTFETGLSDKDFHRNKLGSGHR